MGWIDRFREEGAPIGLRIENGADWLRRTRGNASSDCVRQVAASSDTDHGLSHNHEGGDGWSITVWLRKNAPAVATLWPEAPGDACWYDWRRHVSEEHVATLDRAWKATVGGTQEKEKT